MNRRTWFGFAVAGVGTLLSLSFTNRFDKKLQTMDKVTIYATKVTIYETNDGRRIFTIHLPPNTNSEEFMRKIKNKLRKVT